MPEWRKSSYSGSKGDCVEVLDTGGPVAFRDSKTKNGPVIAFGRGAVVAFLRAVRKP